MTAVSTNTVPTNTVPTTPLPDTLTIDTMRSAADARAFRELNEEWITQLFTLEDADRATLSDPTGRIITPGGAVLIARLHGEPMGCVALVPTGDGVFELSKMAVSPALRNRGAGRRLILAAIDLARQLGATSLFLGSSTKLPAAVHLYEAVGFDHVPAERIGPMPYVRADVFMELILAPAPEGENLQDGPDPRNLSPQGSFAE